VLEEVALWQNRPLEAIYPLVFFDALRVKIRDGRLVRNKAIRIALGVRADGTKEVLGLWIEQNEGAKFWLRVMNELKNRGTEDILLAVVDGLKGFPDAIRAVFPEATVQTCHRSELAPRLARSHSVLRFSCRCSPDPLHHEFHRSAQRQATPCRASPRPFPQ
jgi:transposase-like protein